MRRCECSRGWSSLVCTRRVGPKCGLCVNAFAVWFHYESQILYKARKEPFAVTLNPELILIYCLSLNSHSHRNRVLGHNHHQLQETGIKC